MSRMNRLDRTVAALRRWQRRRVLAQEYPVKPIRWIIPYPTGGTSDFLARIIGQKLTDAWKQPILVDNRSGANGNIGTDAAAKAAGDGYTLLLVASTFTMNPAVYPNLPFDTEKDFAPVTTILWQPYLLFGASVAAR